MRIKSKTEMSWKKRVHFLLRLFHEHLCFTSIYRVLSKVSEYICDALRDLVPFVQFKKLEKHLWRSVNFSKVAGFSLPWVFFTFFKFYKWYQIAQRITYILLHIKIVLFQTLFCLFLKSLKFLKVFSVSLTCL